MCVDADEGPAYGLVTQTIPVGEPIREDGAEGATGPGNSQANGPQEDGSLESGGRLIWRTPTDEVSRPLLLKEWFSANLSGLRTEGVANGAVLASSSATLWRPF